ncbi:MAG: heavy metal-binding domain-containing protein [Oenococcus sp.]|uniref:heavy metal-binding domain-containing protein n=1 Tax=Oenococcus TaxID=46254 RepID=UPI0021E867D1|nr:heavy metal-binding domain-containing protein [Oenococcus kitaharae]MCV3297100.1 heavy metal-binding domain-containing protein [Oenococcus kitaharae]
MTVATTENIAGYQIDETLGEVFGLTTRSRNIVRTFGAGLKTLVGGEVVTWTQLQDQAREESIGRLKDNAASMGADAVTMMRFDSNEANGIMSVVAYGTAVKMSKL